MLCDRCRRQRLYCQTWCGHSAVRMRTRMPGPRSDSAIGPRSRLGTGRRDLKARDFRMFGGLIRRGRRAVSSIEFGRRLSVLGLYAAFGAIDREADELDAGLGRDLAMPWFVGAPIVFHPAVGSNKGLFSAV